MSGINHLEECLIKVSQCFVYQKLIKKSETDYRFRVKVELNKSINTSLKYNHYQKNLMPLYAQWELKTKQTRSNFSDDPNVEDGLDFYYALMKKMIGMLVRTS